MSMLGSFNKDIKVLSHNKPELLPLQSYFYSLVSTYFHLEKNEVEISNLTDNKRAMLVSENKEYAQHHSV